MCGVFCVLSLSSNLPPNILQHGVATLEHRGPDAKGLIYISKSGKELNSPQNAILGLGHTRLSILDLSSNAIQPMRTDEYVLVFNGEIYNFLELRAELKKKGHQFRSDSDTEVILHAYKEWGDDCFNRFNGMWAILLYNKINKTIIASRDRLGVKPLYFKKDADKVVLASEIKAIIASEKTSLELNEQAIFDFLLTGISENRKSTFYRDIVEVPAGSILKIQVNGEYSQTYYHRWGLETRSPGTTNPDELKELLTDSVKLRLRSDAGMVSLLSGGLDSSIITALCADKTTSSRNNLSRSNFKGAYSYGYSDSEALEHDECEAASSFANNFKNLKHIIERYNHIPSEDEVKDLFYIQEQPFPTPSVIAGYRIYKEISKHGFKVALTGEGADELFGGYTKQYLPRLARDHLIRGNLKHFKKVAGQPHVTLNSVLARLVWHLPEKAIEGTLRAFRPNAATIRNGLFNRQKDTFREHIQYAKLPLGEFQKKHIISTNLPMILRFADRNSMAAGIEQRLPFLDYRVVQFALNTPTEDLYKNNLGKYTLRQAFSDTLPNNIAFASKERGFGNAEQFYSKDMITEEALNSPPDFVHEYIDLKKLKALLNKNTPHTTLWLPLSFLMWATYSANRV